MDFQMYEEVKDQILPNIRAFEPFYEHVENAMEVIDIDAGLWVDRELEQEEHVDHIDTQFAGLDPDLLEYDQVPTDTPVSGSYAVH